MSIPGPKFVLELTSFTNLIRVCAVPRGGTRLYIYIHIDICMHIYIYKGLHTYIHIIYTSYPYVVGIISAVFLHVIAQTAHQARLRWSFEDLQLWGSPQMGSQKWLVYDENSSENG